MICFRLRDYHPLWFGFPANSANESFCNFSLKLKAFQVQERTLPCNPLLFFLANRQEGLGSSLFARRYLGNNVYSLFLRLLKCFTSPGLLHMHS